MVARSVLGLSLFLFLIPQPRISALFAQAPSASQQQPAVQPAIPPEISAILARMRQGIAPTPDEMKTLAAWYRQNPENAKAAQGAGQGQSSGASNLPPFGTGMQASLYAEAADWHGKSAKPDQGSNIVQITAGRSSTWSKTVQSAVEQNKVTIAEDVSATIGAVSLSLQTTAGKGVVTGMAGPGMTDTITVPGVFDKTNPKYVTLEFELHINQLSAAGDQYIVAAKAVLLGLLEPSKTKPGNLVGSTTAVALADSRCFNLDDGSGCTGKGTSSTGGGTSVLSGNVTAIAGSTLRLELSGKGMLIDGKVTQEVVGTHAINVRANVCLKPTDAGLKLTAASGLNYAANCK
jgi:hypothetical protein